MKMTSIVRHVDVTLALWLFAWQLWCGSNVEAVALKRQGVERVAVEAQSSLELQADTAASTLYQLDAAAYTPLHSSADGMTIAMDKATNQLKLHLGMEPGLGIAWGSLKDNLQTTGWIELNLETESSTRVSNDIKLYAAGFLEGLMSGPRMSQFYSNFYGIAERVEDGQEALENIKALFKDELEYAQKHSHFVGQPNAGVPPQDPYWKHGRAMLHQLYGLRDGYNHAAKTASQPEITMTDVWMINSHAQLQELVEAYKPDAVTQREKFRAHTGGHAAPALHSTPIANEGVDTDITRTTYSYSGGDDSSNMAPMETLAFLQLPEAGNQSANVSRAADDDWVKRIAKHGRCSALVRLTAESQDLMLGHTTWSDYSRMTRVYKYYHFQLPGAETSAGVIGFSSYPGCVSSTDNFYMLNSGLAVMDTSIEVVDPTVYNRVKDQLPNFMHVMIVNRLAKTGSHWASLYATRTRQTNSAEWIVVDYNLFIAGERVKPNTVWVVEQVPGLTHKADVSEILNNQGYWGGYNRPYFPDERFLTGHKQAEAQYGDLYSYDRNPRATIFKNYAPNVQNLIAMRSLMNRNKFPHEGVLPLRPEHAISSRMDLDNMGGALPNGGIDAKVTNRCLFRLLQSQAISGPTHDDQPVFSWGNSAPGGVQLWPGWPHLGLPDNWDFSWVQMSPTGPLMALQDVTGC
eukprot:TRINITY_DN90936_c0_g1_i1.p1 TRINITY_DN90936_c0_g1~~TRINITY_DN90936_c0_g1_i1.p1  ORF type:complete len:688 (+),score=82.15 TRINITY_DN90936_c0_g1_i1:112-2175(+)